MAAHATMPMPTATPLAPRNGQQAALPDALDFLTSHRRILREAPDGDTAIRWQLEAALDHIATQDATIATLQAQLWEVGQPAARAPRPSLRPAIRALLQERASPMTALQIQEALGTVGAMVGRLNEMVKAGQLTCTDGHYALVGATAVLPPAPAPAEAPGPPARRKGGRIKRPA